jgi:hypothetical protein
MDASAIHELTGIRLNLHALVIEKKVDESLAGIGPGRLSSQGDVLAVAEHGVVSDVIEIGALFVVRQHEAHESDSHRRLAGTDAISGGYDGLDEYGSRGREIADKFFRARLRHDLVEARQPLCCQGVVDWMRHDELAAVLRFDHIF